MDATRLGQLLDDHAAALMLYARQWCAAPEDVVQDAFVKLAAQDPWPESVVAWLYRVVRNRAITAARAEQRRRRHEARAAEKAPAWFEPRDDLLLDGVEVSAALAQLDADRREVLTLHVWGGLTFVEIAKVADCSPSTAHRWYLEALESLRRRFSPCPNRTTES
jgi:RNA polymerase sigma-70 factor (ECF subfamily)